MYRGAAPGRGRRPRSRRDLAEAGGPGPEEARRAQAWQRLGGPGPEEARRSRAWSGQEGQDLAEAGRAKDWRGLVLRKEEIERARDERLSCPPRAAEHYPSGCGGAG